MENGELLYGRCKNPLEFWVQVIEKAYAKLHNCYEALTSGDMAQALSDLTAFLPEHLKIDKTQLVTT